MTEIARRAFIGTIAALGLAAAFAPSPSAAQGKSGDPAVAFMDKAARELLNASRSKSPEGIAAVMQRYGDVGYIGNYALGSYKGQLSPADRQTYNNGLAGFIGRYAAKEAPKYPVASYQILGSSPGPGGTMVDSKIVLRDGSTYEVRWLLGKYGSTYRVRDAMVYGFWMTPFLKKLFEDYIAQNGGNVKALVVALNR